MFMMTWKSFINPNGFKSLERLGFKITTLGETFSKFRLGFLIGAMYNVTIIFGLFATKLVSIPMFLTFRRCAIICTVLVQYVREGTIPSSTLSVALFLMIFGALLAGWETLSIDGYVYLLIWGNNML